MQATFRVLVPLLALLLLAACAGGKQKRVFPPTASIQELRVLEDGRWEVAFRLQNFSNVGMRVAAFETVLRIDGVQASTVTEQPGFMVPAGSAELLRVALAPERNAAAVVERALSQRTPVDYRLTGVIVSSEPDRRRDPFEFDSSLAPVPGLDRSFR